MRKILIPDMGKGGKESAESLRLLHELQVHQVELEQQQAELQQALSSAQDAINLFEFAPIGYFTLNSAGDILKANLHGTQMLGKKQSAIISGNFSFFVSPDTRKTFDQFLEQLFGSTTRAACDINLETLSSTSVWVHLSGIVPANESYCLVTATDITERMLADIALSDSRKRMRAITENSSDIILEVNQQGTILYISRALSGYRIEEVIGKNFCDFTLPEYKSNLMRLFNEAKPATVEIRGMGADGEVRWYSASLSPVHTGSKAQTIVVTMTDISDRREAEKAVRDAQENLSNLVNDMQVGVILQGPDSEILLCNPKAIELLGLSENQMLGKTSLDPDWNVIHEDGSPFPGNTHPVSVSIATRLPVRDVVMGVYRPATRDRIWLLVAAEPQFHEDGAVRQVVCTFIDITKRRKAEESQREYDRLLQESQNLAHIASYTIDLAAQTWKASPEMYRIFGIGQSVSNALDLWVDTIHPEFRSVVESYISTVEQEGTRFDQEFIINRSDTGMARWVHGLGMLEYDEKGNPVSMIGTIQDITEQKLVEENLKKSVQQQHAILQTAMDGFWLVDTQGRLLDVNATYCRMSGYNADELLSRSIHDLEAVETSPETAGRIQRIMAEGEHRFETWHRRKDGSIYNVEISVQYQAAEGGRLVAFIKDITQRKQVELRLKQLNEHLEQLVNERTKELLIAYDALKHSKEKYRTVADYTYDWEYWISQEGTIQYMSPSVARITGYDPEDFIANPKLLDQIVYREDIPLWEKYKREMPNHDQHEQTDELEFRIIARSGRILWIYQICRSISIEGQPRGIRVSNRDITTRIRAEQDLLNITVEVEERERNRFAQELHDDMGPLLSTIKLYFQWLADTQDPEKIKIITEKGNKNIDEAIQVTREMAHGLSSLFLDNAGYVDAIVNFTQRINEMHKLEIKFSFNENKRFGHFLEITLYRITTELINNTLKYASATEIEIVFTATDKNRIIFAYSDNGIGFTPAEYKKSLKGLGLQSIQQRINILKGIFRQKTSPGNGFSVYIELPANQLI